MSELAVLLVRVLSLSTFSTSLLKCLLKISASSSLLLKGLSEKREPTVFQHFLFSDTTLWSSFLKKTYFSFVEQANTETSWAIKTPFRFFVSSF